jgi:hypothetical protein
MCKFIIAICVLFNFLFSQQKKSAPKKQLPLVIKEMSVWDYKLKLGVQEEYGREVQRVLYDASANISETISLLYNGTIDARKIFLYDSSHILLEKIAFQSYYDEDDSLLMFREDSLEFIKENEKDEEPLRMHYVMDARKQRLDSMAMHNIPLFFYGSSIVIIDYFYDDSGRIAEKTLRRNTYSRDDSVTMEYIDSIEVLAPELGFDGDTQPVLKNSYSYDDANNLIEDITSLHQKKIHSRTYKYDNKSRCTEKVFFDAAGKAMEKLKFRYTSFHQPSEIILYNSEGNISGKFFKKYDRNKNETESLLLDTHRVIHSRTIRAYDNFHKILSEEQYVENKFEYKGVFRYDKAGRKSEQQIFLHEQKAPKMLRKFRYKMWEKK